MEGWLGVKALFHNSDTLNSISWLWHSYHTWPWPSCLWLWLQSPRPLRWRKYLFVLFLYKVFLNLSPVGLSTHTANCAYNPRLQESAFSPEAQYWTWLEFERTTVIRALTIIFHTFSSYLSHYPNALLLCEVIKWVSKHIENRERNS